MSVYKCKMCGGNLDICEGVSVVACEYCGTKQTVPKSRDEVVSNLFDRANNLRLKCEFDKAEQIYERILDIDNTDSEAHWGIVLCKYGIEYVEDPKTYLRIPTCHRTLYEAVLTDVDYLAAIENADAEQKELYIEEAKIIDKLQKNILTIVNNEEPFDVFICYKETDENGKRTVDSAIANDIYYQLTGEGFKVFYAPITLEDKLGHEYEPYIFAALNSAKVMLVVGTKPEYFDSVWVRNEWSRFIKLSKTDRSKLLIPCYKDMDVYELPDEFAHLQAQDMGKIGFITDVIRGLKKVFNKEQQSKERQKTMPKNFSPIKRIAPVVIPVLIFLIIAMAVLTQKILSSTDNSSFIEENSSFSQDNSSYTESQIGGTDNSSFGSIPTQSEINKPISNNHDDTTNETAHKNNASNVSNSQPTNNDSETSKPFKLMCPLPQNSYILTGVYGRGHNGIDLAAPLGTSIYAAESGTVVFSGWDNSDGFKIIVDHGSGFTTVYAHCSELLKENGDEVQAGEIIAKVGSTGSATGYHLHFGVIENKTSIDPMQYIELN